MFNELLISVRDVLENGNRKSPNEKKQKLVRLCGPQLNTITIICKNNEIDKYKNYVYIYIYVLENMVYRTCLKRRTFENLFLLYLVQMKGWYAVYRIEETKLVCAISRTGIFG